MQLFDRFLRVLALASGVILLLMMTLTVTDVFMRYVFNMPFSGTWEITEFSMAAVVFLAMAYCGWTGGHIAVDMFEHALSRPHLRFIPATIAFVGAALFAVIAWRATLETLDTLSQVSNMLRWPHYPFRLTVTFGAAVFAIVLFIQGVAAARAQPNEKSDNGT